MDLLGGGLHSLKASSLKVFDRLTGAGTALKGSAPQALDEPKGSLKGSSVDLLKGSSVIFLNGSSVFLLLLKGSCVGLLKESSALLQTKIFVDKHDAFGSFVIIIQCLKIIEKVSFNIASEASYLHP